MSVTRAPWSMSEAVSVIKRLLPNGSRDVSGVPDWDEPPAWPPDLFAVATTVVQRSSCYAQFNVRPTDSGEVFSAEYIDQVKRLGTAWGQAPENKEAYWPELVSLWKQLQEAPDGSWQVAAIKLM